MNTVMRDEAIEAGIIDEVAHVQLLSDIAGYTRTAGIPEHFVWTSANEYCGPDEIEYIGTIKKSLNDRDGVNLGMVYVGDVDGAAINERMMAIAGVCLRNYINAKVMTVQAVLDSIKQATMPTNVSVLLIPNFFSSRADGGRIAEWEVANLLGLLYQRQQDGKHTILHVSNMKELGEEYGSSFKKHLQGKFVTIT
jgi:hypothetical protein